MCINSKLQNTEFPFYQCIKQAKQRHGDRYKLTHSQLEANMTTSVLECILRTNVREFKRFAKQTHGNQYKLINTLTTRSKHGYKRSGVHTPSNVREFKRFTATNRMTTSAESR